MPFKTTEEAPTNSPSSHRTTAAIELMAEFFEVAASTLILNRPAGGAIHFFFWFRYARSSSLLFVGFCFVGPVPFPSL
jgi:hypothetical protein